MKPNRVEIELSSRCNASCPGCRRTMLLNSGEELPLLDLPAELIYERFSQFDLTDFRVKLCGVLGDPLIHPQMDEIAIWFAEHGAYVEISTNGSLRSIEYWRRLGEVSARTRRIDVRWAVDGLETTNHMYRVNTNFTLIDANMRAYAGAGGIGSWIFIEFDHNIDQKEEARTRSAALGFPFLVRRAAKNSIFDWKVEPKTKSQLAKTPSEYAVTKQRGEAHPQTQLYKEILEGKQLPASSIDCKWVHGGEFFLASNGSVWPCCFLWDEYQVNARFITLMDQTYGKQWNDFHTNSFDQIFKHPYYEEVLEHSWEMGHPMGQPRCFRSCGAKGQLRNNFSNN